MTWLSLCLPLFLGIHNMIDFRDFGAKECYATYLSYTVTEFVEMIETNNNIRLINHSGHMDDRIHHITLNFEAGGGQTIEGARNLIVGLLDSFLTAINKGCCGRLPPYLCPCPFTPDNVDIEIHFVGDCLYNYPKPGTIQYVSFSGDKIGYYVQDPVCGGVSQIRTEPLAMALKLAAAPQLLCPEYVRPCLPETLREFIQNLPPSPFVAAPPPALAPPIYVFPSPPLPGAISDYWQAVPIPGQQPPQLQR